MRTLSFKYRVYMIIGIIILATVIMGGTYAIFRKVTTQNSTNIVSTLDCVDVSIVGNSNTLNLHNAYPLTYVEAMETQPYRFTVRNNCNTYVKYQIVMSVVNTTTITNREYVKIDLDGLTYNKNKKLSELIEEPQQGLVGYLNNYTLVTSAFDGNESHVYNFRMWLNADNEDIWEDETITNQNITVKLSIVGVVQKKQTLEDKILAQGGGKSIINAKGNPDFSNIATAEDTGLYATSDEYGISYYYRGLKTELNNNLIWGGFQWKIVRINGDGSIRLIYNGTEADFNQKGIVNDIGINTQINGTFAWNSTYNNDAKYLGYMYGGENGVSSTSREEAIRNETPSNIKNTLENWYENNILGKPFENLVVDNLFCNNRKLARGPGYGIEFTDYNSREYIVNRKSPTLKCEDKNDRFSLNNTIGNGKQTYPIGLITADELAMAGLVFYNEDGNTNNYLYNNSYYLSFTPSCVFENKGYMVVVSNLGYLANDEVNNPYYRVRPVISIRGDIEVIGDGSATNPFRVDNINLKDKILADEGGPAVIEAKGNPNFSNISSSSDSGLYAANDNYGKSYYFRGNKNLVKNNLLFAGYQWKIVRINGNGSIRLVYNGDEYDFDTNGTMNDIGLSTQIWNAAWNLTNYNDAKYVGFMYGGTNGNASTKRNGTDSNSATYNESSSYVKSTLELWYDNNFSYTSYETLIVDNLFCNDRRIESEIGGSPTGPGYGNTGLNTFYAARYRLYTNKTPSLQCVKNDSFTQNNNSGNGNLTYPIGLLTADEMAFAGIVYNINNTSNYLYTNQNYWSLSPSIMSEAGYARLYYLSNQGALLNVSVDTQYGVRPVISIRGDVRFTGTGTLTDPYRVL